MSKSVESSSGFAIGKKISGFTLIELLVVISIIGLLSTLAVVALGAARVKARDSQRLANMNQFQRALELYYDKNTSSYINGCRDSSGTALALPQQINACIGGGGNLGIAEYMPNIVNFKDPVGTGACANPATALCNYTWQSAAQGNYVVSFWQEGGDDAGQLTEKGIAE